MAAPVVVVTEVVLVVVVVIVAGAHGFLLSILGTDFVSLMPAYCAARKTLEL